MKTPHGDTPPPTLFWARPVVTFDTNFESQFPQDFDFILGPFWLHRGPHLDLAREADPDLANLSESLPSQTQLGRQIQTWRDLADVARHSQTTHRNPARFSQASLNPVRFYTNFESQFPQDFSVILAPFWLHFEPHGAPFWVIFGSKREP